MTPRTLTVRESEDRYKVKNGRVKSKPQIALRGNWLLVAGFSPGDRVVVEIENNKLIITVTED